MLLQIQYDKDTIDTYIGLYSKIYACIFTCTRAYYNADDHKLFKEPNLTVQQPRKASIMSYGLRWYYFVRYCLRQLAWQSYWFIWSSIINQLACPRISCLLSRTLRCWRPKYLEPCHSIGGKQMNPICVPEHHRPNARVRNGQSPVCWGATTRYASMATSGLVPSLRPCISVLR